MMILGIETSCDETAAAVVRDGGELLSSIVNSQVAHHAPYGGVVPEIASRCHLENLPTVIREALAQAAIGYDALDAIAVTYGPGLASSLLVGLSAAKGLALALAKPLIAIDHIEAHTHSALLAPGAPPLSTVTPLLALVVSGGHTALIAVGSDGNSRIIGQTLDDAAGEAFDKGAQLLGLGYPGGPAIERAARAAPRSDSVRFPRGRISAGNPSLAGMRADFCFSFSGLKTAMMHHLRAHPPTDEAERAALAAAYQEAIVEALALRCERALRTGQYRALAIGGGVSLNGVLRTRLQSVAKRHAITLLLPEARLCGDNAAMIAALAARCRGITGAAAMTLDVHPRLSLPL